MAGPDERASKCLCFRLTAGLHLIPPGRIGQTLGIHIKSGDCLSITAIKDVIDVSFIGHNRGRLQITDLVRPPDRRKGR